MEVGVFGWKDSLIVVVVIRCMTKSVYVILFRDFFLPTDVLSYSSVPFSSKFSFTTKNLPFLTGY